jgi:hypothetical protein
MSCGDGTETALLLARGWNVLAVDGESAGIKWLMDKVAQVRAMIEKFETEYFHEQDEDGHGGE